VACEIISVQCLPTTSSRSAIPRARGPQFASNHPPSPDLCLPTTRQPWRARLRSRSRARPKSRYATAFSLGTNVDTSTYWLRRAADRRHHRHQAAPPKTKYIEHILVATHAGEAGVGEVFRALQYRLRDSTWTIVFKSLITIHLMMREGSPDVTLAYLAKHKNILAVSVFSDGQSWARLPQLQVALY